MVLYGYSGSQERSVGHAISGVSLPENSGERPHMTDPREMLANVCGNKI